MKAFLLWLILCSCRKASRLLELLEFASKSSINEWCLRFRAILEAKEWEKSKKHLTIAIDKTCIKLKGKKFWVYASIDVDTRSL